jgi:hypothetical protein
MKVYEPTADLGVALQEAGNISVNGSLRGKSVMVLDNGWASYGVAGPVLKEELERRFGVEEVVEFRKEMVEPATEEMYQVGTTKAGLIITFLGNCGGCTSWSVHDASEFTKMGRPSISFVTAKFKPLAEIVSRGKGVAGLPIVELPADFEQSTPEEIRESIRRSMDQIAELLHITDQLVLAGAGSN